MKIAAPGMMIHEAKSPYDFNTTVTTINSNTQNEGWKVTNVYYFQKSINEQSSCEGRWLIWKVAIRQKQELQIPS